MFKVVVKKTHEFYVIVKGFSKVDSLVSNVKYGTYKIVEKINILLTSSSNIETKSSFIISKICDILWGKSQVKMSQNRASGIVSAIESVRGNKISNTRRMEMFISSNDFLSSTTKSSLLIISDPLVGYFRKIAEFDSIPLSELDRLTLEEMDFIMRNVNEKLE